MKILVVDDDRELCSMLGEFFRQQGFAVACERDGTRGLSRATTEPFDLLILDVMLPGIDGFRALEALRRKSHIPVLMLTARSAGREDSGFRAGRRRLPSQAIRSGRAAGTRTSHRIGR